MSLSEEKLKLLNDAYYSEGIGRSALHKYLGGKVTHKDIKEFIASSSVAQQHKPSGKAVYHTTVGLKGGSYQVDLIFEPYAAQNSGYIGAMVCIHVDTKKAFGYPIKDKSGAAISEVMKEFLSDIDNKIASITIDEGKEFDNNLVKQLLLDLGVTIYAVKSTQHGAHAVIDRFCKTIKDKIERYFTASDTVRWVDKFKSLIAAYNKSKHSTIKQAPNDVDSEDEKEIRKDAVKRGEPARKESAKFKVGDHVRVKKKKGIFDKGTRAGWSRIVYNITAKSGHGFIVADSDGNTLPDKYTHNELQKVEQIVSASAELKEEKKSDEPAREEIDRAAKVKRRIAKEKIDIVPELRRSERSRKPKNRVINEFGEVILWS